MQVRNSGVVINIRTGTRNGIASSDLNKMLQPSFLSPGGSNGTMSISSINSLLGACGPTSQQIKQHDIHNHEATDAPDQVVGNYRNDLNILKIHDAILYRFSHRKGEILSLNRQLIDLRSRSRDICINESRDLDSQIANLEKEIAKRVSDDERLEYIRLSDPILKQYGEISSDVSRGIIKIRPSNTIDPLGEGLEHESPEKIAKRIEIIERYLDLANRYIGVNIIRVTADTLICPNCGIEIVKTLVEDEGLSQCCCGYERETLSMVPLFKDSSRINIGSRNNYDNGDNFHKALMRFQGKQVRKPPQRLYEQLDERAISLGRPTGAQVRELPLLSNGRKEGTFRQLMLNDLSETNNSAYYEDINLICHVHWGWTLPNVSHLEDKIMEDYRATQEVYNSLPNKERTASLHIQFRLYVHLKALDYPCEREDFKMQVLRESLIFHQECWEKMCAATGVKFTKVV